MNDHFAEFGIIASVMEHPHILSGVREALDVSDFLSEKNRVVWRAICELDDNGITPGWDALLEHLTAAGDLHKVGGATGLAEMIDGVPRSDEPSSLIRIVKRLSHDHSAASAFEQIRLALDDGQQPSEVLAEHLPKLVKLQQQATAGRKPRFELIPVSALGNLPSSEFLPATHIVRGGYILVYGLSETGKSLWALMQGAIVSRYGVVVYVCAEGSGGLAVRCAALESHGFDLAQVYFITEAVNLLDSAQVSEFIAICKAQFPDGVLLTVFDTKSRMMAGADENNAKDDSLQVDNCNRIQRELGSSILMIHHSGKTDLSARGSGVTFNAADCVLHFRRDDDLVTVSVQSPAGKLKDGSKWPDETYSFVNADESVLLLPSDQVASQYGELSPQQIDVLRAMDTLGGASIPQIVAATGIPERTVYRVIKLLKASELCQKGLGRDFQISVAGRASLPSLPNVSRSSKPNGHREIVEDSATLPTLCQPSAKGVHYSAATLSLLESGEVAELADRQDGERLI